MQYPEIDIHTHKKASGDIFISSYLIGRTDVRPTGVYATGIHPWDAEKVDFTLLVNAIKEETVAIGEIGLDFISAISLQERQRQEILFRKQLNLAVKLKLPVIIHCVKAYNEIIKILQEYDLQVIIHGFTGSLQLAQQLTDIGYYLSFGENLFRSPKTQEALQQTDLHHIFLETDGSELTISAVYKQASEILDISEEVLRKQIYENYQNVFDRG